MKQIGQNSWQKITKTMRLKPRLLRDIRFNANVETHWEALDFVAIPTKSGNEGVIVAELHGDAYALSYEIKRSITDTRTGRSKPIICDFCYTWQRGGNAANITFTRSDGSSLTYLCCADLLCSLHVRGLTPQAALSRSQLREDIDDTERIVRLRRRLEERFEYIGTAPITV